MTTFYDEWLLRSQRNEHDVHAAPVVARGAELTWIETPHDFRTAVLIGAANGFPTQGTVLLKAQLPAGAHTGSRVNGEEALFVLSGTGFIVVDERRYDFKPGTVIHVPYMSDHQLVNTGTETAEYLTAMTTDLDLDVKLGRFEQRSEKGTGNDDLEHRYPAEDTQFAPNGRRIALHAEDRIDENARREAERKKHNGHADHGHAGHNHGAIWILMGGRETQVEEDDEIESNGFVSQAVAMTHIFEETPHTRSHKHSHTEAYLYVLEGSGYSEIDGTHYDWTAGDAVHVPPKMTVHEHFNNSDAHTRTLRIEFGIRYFYEGLWDGYKKIEHRLGALALEH